MHFQGGITTKIVALEAEAALEKTQRVQADSVITKTLTDDIALTNASIASVNASVALFTKLLVAANATVNNNVRSCILCAFPAAGLCSCGRHC